MKQVTTHANTVANYIVGSVLALVPFQAFLTVWASSLAGHYTALRLVDDILAFVLLGIVCVWLVRDVTTRTWLMESLLVRIILTYTVLTLLLGVVSYTKGEVTLKALAYGILINLRYLGWFLAVLLTAQRSPFLKRAWPKLLIVPAVIVVLFGILQYTVLPHNFLSHFSYNAATTIAPIETINNNGNYIRAQSTLRGANPLGAYLVIIVSALGVMIIRSKRKIIFGLLILMTLIALYASGSRSAWIGALLCLGSIGWLSLRSRRSRIVFGCIGLTVLVLAGSAYILLKNNVSLQNEVLHTQSNSAVKTTSNGAHASALKNGITDVEHQPFGDGPGTAGPASVYNSTHPARIAEDYYVQIAQETGILGLVLFLMILMLVAMELFSEINNSPLACIVFVSLIGITFVNLLSHAWADDTLAYAWWGFAGVALGVQSKKEKREV
jgi:hypothetical protein